MEKNVSKEQESEVLQTYRRLMTIVDIGTPQSVYSAGKIFMTDKNGTSGGGWRIERVRSFAAGVRITNDSGYVDVPWANVACLWG